MAARNARNGASRSFDIVRIGSQHLTANHNFRVLTLVACLAAALVRVCAADYISMRYWLALLML